MPISIGARTAFEKFILDRQKQLAASLGKRDYQITPQEYDKAALEFFGPIPLPQGAQVISQTGTSVTYKGADGKTYTAKRNTDSNLGNVDIGRIETSLGTGDGSLVPAIGAQSAAGEQDFAKQLLAQLQSQVGGGGDWLSALMKNIERLQQNPTLAPLDANTQAQLKAITDAQLAQLNQQFTDQSGDLTARLFGQGINRSSIAGSQANRLLQGQGLVTQQALGDAAQRQLSLQQALTALGQQGLSEAGSQLIGGGNLQNNQVNTSSQLLMALLNQALQRETAGVSLGLEQRGQDRQQAQFDKNYGLANTQFETQDQQRRHANNVAMWNSIIAGIAGIAGGPLGALAASGIGSLFGGATAAAAPIAGAATTGVNTSLSGLGY